MNIPADLLPDSLLKSLPLIGLYAETHFRFKIPFSRYFRKQPELIFDTPWRWQPGEKPTFFLVIHDADHYPLLLESVSVEVRQGERHIGRQVWPLQAQITSRHTQLTFVIDKLELPAGPVELVPVLKYQVAGRSLQMIIDNYLQTSKTPLRATVATDPLPQLPGWLAGDTHLHTSLTADQIEFGASLEMTRQAGQLFGLDFIAATDHSYDLDDQPEDYLRNDPELRKWQASRQAIAALNEQPGTTILPGEEISAANAQGATIHFLHFNDPEYFPGSGDSGEDWPKLRSQLSINDILTRRSTGTVSVGAHTGYKFPWLQRVLLNRGFWKTADHEHPELDGVQLLCGTPAAPAFLESRQLWIDALLTGKRLAAYGGSDGHGNLNRNWHVKLPVWSLGIHEDQIFAQSRTLLRSPSHSTTDLITAMQAKRTAVSTGPVGDLQLTNDHETLGIGETLSCPQGTPLSVTLTGLSTPEFGDLMDFTLYYGNFQTVAEQILIHEIDQVHIFSLELEFTPPAAGYIRLEITTEGARWPGLFLSSPIWLEFS